VNEVLAMIEKMLGRDLRLDHSVRAKGDPSRTGGDTTKLVEKTGWIAETSLADGIAAQIAWCQSDPAAEVSGH
jgi:UDP-glucose 4-epimerase